MVYMCIIWPNANTDLTYSQNWGDQTKQTQADCDLLGHRQNNLGGCDQ